MKKIYQQPGLYVCVIGSTTMIAVSQDEIIVDPSKPPVDDDIQNYVKGKHTDIWSENW